MERTEMEMKIEATEWVMMELGHRRQEITLPSGSEAIIYTKETAGEIWWLQFRYTCGSRLRKRKVYTSTRGQYFNHYKKRVYL